MYPGIEVHGLGGILSGATESRAQQMRPSGGIVFGATATKGTSSSSSSTPTTSGTRIAGVVGGGIAGSTTTETRSGGGVSEVRKNWSTNDSRRGGLQETDHASRSTLPDTKFDEDLVDIMLCPETSSNTSMFSAFWSSLTSGRSTCAGVPNKANDFNNLSEDPVDVLQFLDVSARSSDFERMDNTWLSKMLEVPIEELSSVRWADFE